MNLVAHSLEAHDLMRDGTIAMASLEEAGIAVDVSYLRQARIDVEQQIKGIRAEVDATPEGRSGLARYRQKWDALNNHQTAAVLAAAGHALPTTAKGNPSTADNALDDVGIPFTDGIRKMRKLTKIKGTYIDQWLREVGPDGYMHPGFHLNTVTTYRSSSSEPNFQNVPRRDEEAQRILRRAIIPSAGNRLLEVDYGAMEVRIIACYTHDPILVDYICSGKDMHADVASWFFDIPRPMVSKDIRDIAKNGITFPEFYGSWWKPCAQAVWLRICREGPKLKDGSSLKDHVKTLANLEALFQRGEEKFWKKFAASRQWQDTWYKKYTTQGWFEMLTGHHCSGVMKKNDLYNYPVQGTAFLCLLWDLIQLVKWQDDSKIGTRIMAQIHDSIFFDVVPDEFDMVLNMTREVMSDRIRKQWPWIIVPLLVEAKASEVDGNWSEMLEVK